MRLLLRSSLWTSGLVVALLNHLLVSAADEPIVRDKALSYWIKLLDEGGPVQRKAAAKALQRPQGLKEDTINTMLAPALAKALKEDKMEGVRLECAKALEYLGPPAKAAVPALADALKDKNAEVRMASARALGAIGSAAEAATPNLIASMKDPSEEVRRLSVTALGQIGHASDDVIATLKSALQASLINAKNPCAPAWILKALGGLGKAAVPILIDAAITLGVGTDGEGKGRDGFYHPNDYRLALESLAKIGPNAKEAVPTLVKLLGHKKGLVYRQKAAQALGAIGPDAKEALPILERMRREDKEAGQEAAEAIKKIEAK